MAAAPTLLPGFSESVVTGLSIPTAMAIAPDGRIFVCEQGGALRVIKNGALLATPFVSLTVDPEGERGLLGIAFDPSFTTNGFVYVYYTATTSPRHNRVSRLTANGDVAVAGSEVPILDLENLSASNHNGGAIHFGPDGKLYVAVGENANSANAQTLSNRLGKMLRINADGTIPPDNPFFASAAGANRSIWALGLRNPFTFAFNPGGSHEMFINDVGASTWEEIDVGAAGANYGWPNTEGPTTNPNFVSPKHAYGHTPECAISGGAFYSPVISQFPADYAGDYFFADVCAGWIKRLDLASNQVTPFAAGVSSPVDLRVASDGSLYYLALGDGTVRRVQFAGPVAPALTAFTNGLTLSLSWTAVAGATSYRVEGGSASGLGDLANADIGPLTSIETVVPAGTYFLRVRAVSPQGLGPASNEVRVTPAGGICAIAPPAPLGVVAHNSGVNALISWDRSPSATTYVLEAGTAPGFANLFQGFVGPVTSLAAIGPVGTYYTRVRAANACGVSAPSPDASLTLSCDIAPPGGLALTQTGTIVTLQWTASPSTAASYRIQVGSAQGLSNLLNVDIGAATVQSINIAGAPLGRYFIRIVAGTTCGTSAPTNEVILTVP